MHKIILLIGFLITSSFSQFHQLETELTNFLIEGRLKFEPDPLLSTDSVSGDVRRFEAGLSFNDIYREWTDQRKVISSGQYGYNLGLRIPVRWFKKTGQYR